MTQRRVRRQSLAIMGSSVAADARRLLSASGWAGPPSRFRNEMPNLT